MLLINNDIKLNKLISIIQKNNIMGLDVEGSGLDPYTSKLLLIQLSDENEQYIINVGKVSNRLVTYLLKLLKEKNVLLIGHNIKYDIKMLYHNYKILLTNLFDTMLAETLSMPGVIRPYNSYADVVLKHLGIKIDKEERMSFVGKEDFEFTEEQLVYATKDVLYLLPLMRAQSKILDKKQGKDVWKLEMDLEPVVMMMEYQGLEFDATSWMKLAEQSERMADEYSDKITHYLADKFDIIAGKFDNAYEAATNLCIPVKTKKKREELKSIIIRDDIVATIIPMIKMSSPKQAKNLLQKLGIPTKSSSQKELQKFKGHEFIDLLFKYREYFKAGHAFGREFLDAINPITGRIHSTFEQCGAATGRFASNNPNMQNIKRGAEYRACIRARPNFKFFTADYSQIELRILAQVSGEPLMIDAFQHGKDLHALTASIIFNKSLGSVSSSERSRAKNVNFAVVYGTTEYGLRKNFGWSLEQGREYLNRFFSTYTTLRDFIDVAGTEVLRRGYSITQYGRLRYFTLPKKLTRRDMFLIGKVKRQGVNHIIQGSSADMIKLNLYNMFMKNPFDRDVEHPDNFRVLLTVHDEGDGEVRQDLEKPAREFISECMREASKPFLSDVPVDFDIKFGDSWRK